MVKSSAADSFGVAAHPGVNFVNLPAVCFDGEYEFDQIRYGSRDLEAVAVEEEFGERRCGAFVAADPRMVFDESVKHRCGLPLNVSLFVGGGFSARGRARIQQVYGRRRRSAFRPSSA